MAIRRLPGPFRAVPLQKVDHTLYEVELSAAPSLAWRAAFLRPPARLTSVRYTPELGRVGLHGATVHFRTAPHRVRFWLRRIDRWVAYANSVVKGDGSSLGPAGGVGRHSGRVGRLLTYI